jgi:hypothetical protein
VAVERPASGQRNCPVCMNVLSPEDWQGVESLSPVFRPEETIVPGSTIEFLTPAGGASYGNAVVSHDLWDELRTTAGALIPRELLVAIYPPS